MATPAEKKPAVPRPPAPEKKTAGGGESKGGGAKLLIGLGALVALIVGVVVLWNWFTARMEEKMKGQGGEERIAGEVRSGPPGSREKRSREIGGEKQDVNVVQGVSNAVDPDEEDLSAPEKKKKPPRPVQQPLPANLPPAERSWRTVKGDYDRLESNNEATAKKYRMRIIVLEGKRDTVAEAAFIKEANALDEQLRVELAKPENQ